MTYHFPKKILGNRKSYLAELQRTYENLTTNLGKSYEVSKIGPQVYISLTTLRRSWVTQRRP